MSNRLMGNSKIKQWKRNKIYFMDPLRNINQLCSNSALQLMSLSAHGFLPTVCNVQYMIRCVRYCWMRMTTVMVLLRKNEKYHFKVRAFLDYLWFGRFLSTFVCFIPFYFCVFGAKQRSLIMFASPTEEKGLRPAAGLWEWKHTRQEVKPSLSCKSRERSLDSPTLIRQSINIFIFCSFPILTSLSLWALCRRTASPWERCTSAGFHWSPENGKRNVWMTHHWVSVSSSINQ